MFGQKLETKMSQHISMADQQLKEHILKTVHKKVIIFIYSFSLIFHKIEWSLLSKEIFSMTDSRSKVL